MRRLSRDTLLVLFSVLGIVAVIGAISIFSPESDNADPTPTTYNSGTDGAKAAYLLLQKLGYDTARWDRTISALDEIDAAHTTFILAEPWPSGEDNHRARQAMESFLQRGGRVLATGAGGYYLPQSEMSRAARVNDNLCSTTPEGRGDLARAGTVTISGNQAWASDKISVRVQQRCNQDAVVVSYRVGSGEAIWWSSAMPLTNAGLKEDGSLRLLLASIGPSGRRVLFDEFVHGNRVSPWDFASGIPIRSLALQFGLIALLLLVSFSRRHGPTRALLQVPRTSPLEFAESMGQLYGKAGATAIAVDCSRRRVVRYLYESCGVPAEVLRDSPKAIADAVQQRFGGDWSKLEEHLKHANGSEFQSISPATALSLVIALNRDLLELKNRIQVQSSARKGSPSFEPRH
ncbi:hypothetical protein GCM10011507_25980 [Edaphobacter acidisoli]|uniref:DUF4350 domain-containing protein n=1 Tax=Edaphobacter acidisoli TaxID=2040573 RepID=A0A916RYL7_9BACT|nr:DUF4350 domain-containing protein [Edaphobacter acidisoli]GGA73174.1 hypothetical protein GCM10011507_25980 [Edaphobacter acidisoli]